MEILFVFTTCLISFQEKIFTVTRSDLFITPVTDFVIHCFLL